MLELRTREGAALRPPPVGTRLELPGGGRVELVAPYAGERRLVVGRLELGAPLEQYLDRHGHPIRYRYVRTSFRSTRTRRSSPCTPAAPRCRARPGRSRPSW